MRQLSLYFFLIVAPVAFSQTPSEAVQSIAEKKIELARQELRRISELVTGGALPRIRLDQAQQDLADAEDDAVLSRTLYGDLPAQNLTEQMADDMVAAAQRRVERQQIKIQQALKLVDGGITARVSLEPLQEELKMRELNLSLAHSRAKLIGELASLARFEKSMQQIEDATKLESYRDYVGPGMEHFEGSGTFVERKDLKKLETAFAKQFDRSLPISADGETAVHRALGLDHRGRVDVAVNPEGQEGIWLRHYLKSHDIPFYAFTRAIPGKATAAHIHIGPGSTRLHNAD
jgi:hypothetical protein